MVADGEPGQGPAVDVGLVPGSSGIAGLRAERSVGAITQTPFEGLRTPLRLDRAVPWAGATLLISTTLAALPVRDSILLAGGLTAILAGTLAPVTGLVLLAFGVPFGTEAGLTLGGFRVGLAEAGAVLAAGGWFLQASSRHRFALRGLWPWIPLAALLAVALASAAQAQSLNDSVKEIAKWVLFGVCTTLAADLVRDNQRLMLVVAALLTAGAAEALYGLSQSSAGAGPLGFVLGGSLLRAFGTFGQPNPFAAYLGTVAVVAGALVLALGARKGSLLVGAIACVLLAGIATSLSRSAWVGLLAAAAVVVALHFRRGVLIIGVAALAGVLTWSLAGVGWLPAILATRIESITQSLSWFDPQSVPLTSANFAVVHRMAIWQAAWEMFQENAWFGVGPGNFDTAYPLYALPGWPQPPGHAHNFYLNLLAETGIAGLVAYLGLLGSMGVGTVRAVTSAKASFDSLRYGAALAGVGLVAFLSVYQLFDNLYVHSMTAQAGLIFGLALAAASGDEHHHP